jgi:hypothetical protein
VNSDYETIPSEHEDSTLKINLWKMKAHLKNSFNFSGRLLKDGITFEDILTVPVINLQKMKIKSFILFKFNLDFWCFTDN